MSESVSPNEKQKKKIHNVFEHSFDAKRIVNEKFLIQKLKYMHKNPVSGKWKLVEDYIDYLHSSARFYETGEQGVYKVIYYMEVMEISAEFPAQIY